MLRNEYHVYDFKVRELDSVELKKVQDAIKKPYFDLIWLASIGITLIMLVNFLFKIISGDGFLMENLLFYFVIIIIGWLPSFRSYFLFKMRRKRISEGEVLGVSARCIDKIKQYKEHNNRYYRYVFSTDLGEIKTLTSLAIRGSSVSVDDIVYILKVSKRNAFILKID